MKRKSGMLVVLSVIFTLTLSIGILCGCTSTTDGLAFRKTSENSYSVGIGTATDSDIIIPETYDGLPVTSIDSSFGNHSIQSIQIPKSIVSIDPIAIYGQQDLLEIKVAKNNLKYSSQNGVLFNKDKSELICYPAGKSDPSYRIPDSVTTISGKAFSNSKISVIQFSPNIREIESYAFSNSSLETVSIPEKVTKINYGTFEDCALLEEVILSESIMTIAERAFENCVNLTSIVLPSSLEKIDDLAFHGCYKLVEVYNLSPISIDKGSEGNGHIGAYAVNIFGSLGEASRIFTTTEKFLFLNSDSIYLIGYKGSEKDITLPETFNGRSYKLYDYAFAYNKQINKLTIPKSLSEFAISNNAFLNCSNLTDLIFGGLISVIGEKAFYDCSRLSGTININARIIGDYAFYGCHCLEKVNFSNAVTTIGSYSFSNCHGLRNVTIPKNIKNIGCASFSGCENINATFENKNGWERSKNADFSSSEIISSSAISKSPRSFLTSQYYLRCD